MGIWQSIRASLELLSKRDRRILFLLMGIQFLLALLDFAGVILFGLVAAISASAVSGELPGQIASVIDFVGLSNLDVLTLAVVLAVIAGMLFITKSILTFLVMRRSYRFLATRQAMVSGKLVSLLLSRSILFVQQRSSQETAYALTAGTNAATLGVLGSAVALFTEAALIVVVLTAMFAVDVAVAAFSVVFFAVIAALLHKLLANWAGELGAAFSGAEISSIAAVQESLRTYREVIVTGRRGFYAQRFRDLRWRAASVQADMQIMSQVSKYVFEIALIVGAATLALSQFWTKDLVAAVAVISVFLAATSRIVPALLRLQGAMLTLRSSSGIASQTLRLAEDLLNGTATTSVDDRVTERVRESIDSGHRGFDASVELDRATITYPSALTCAVSNVSLDVPPGSSLAVVGPTGAGKSTLVDLVLGVLTADSGSVRISGLPPTEATLQWPGALAYVPQDIAVIDGTVRSNVALGLPAEIIDDDQIWEALDRAQLGDFLRGEREGIETVVGEHGVRLSGGQRQRLGLARALFTRPRLLVLDEATSALDAETELSVSQALEQLEGNVTLIIVAHRLATIRHCDQVAYLQDGELKALGSFTEVRERVPGFDRQAELLGL